MDYVGLKLIPSNENRSQENSPPNVYMSRGWRCNPPSNEFLWNPYNQPEHACKIESFSRTEGWSFPLTYKLSGNNS